MVEPISAFLGTTILGALVSYAVSASLDATVVAQLRGLLGDNRKARAFDAALKAAADKFRVQHPELAEQLFDEAFLKDPTVLADLAKLLTTTGKITADAIADAVWRSTDAVPDEVVRAADDFLRAMRSAIDAQEVLAPDYDRRCLAETHETVAIIAEDLRRLWEEVRPAEDAGTMGPVEAPVKEQAIRDAFGSASRLLLRWPQETGRRWIERPQLASLKDIILDKPHSVSIVLGPPGCGKSALLARLGKELCEQDVALLALKVDEMPREVGSAATMAHWLETPAPVDKCVQQLAGDHLVVLLIDQLDAVGELIDVHTSRLNTLLALVNRLLAIPNVHIVLSCRRFDFEYDVRFNKLEAEAITLGDLSWDKVEPMLRDRGLDPSSWSEAARKVLCTPQHLRLFVDHLAGTEEAPAFDSYHSMLEAVFSLRFKGLDRQSLVDTLGKVAMEIAGSEELWQPRARFDSDYAGIDQLVGLGFLRLSTDGKRVTFEHQTIFDFVRARAFVQKEHLLADYVQSKQGSLFVRPILWSALHYLRSADPAMYRQQLKQLWETPDLRLHVRLLLISFLGRQPEPADHEEALLLPAIDNPRLQEKVLLAISGSPGWFQRVKARLPELMAAKNEIAGQAGWVLQRAINFDRDEVLDLVEKHWLPDEDRDGLVFDALRGLERWDDRATRIVESLVQRLQFRSVWVEIIAEKASESCPECAARIVRGALQGELESAKAAEPVQPTEPPEDASEEDKIAYHMEVHRGRYERYEKLLDHHTDWHRLDEWSIQHPSKFLEYLWPWFLEVISYLAEEPNEYVEDYGDCHGLCLNLDPAPERGEKYTIPAAIQAAVRAFSEETPAEFLAFVQRQQTSDMKPVHILLAQGLEKIASTHSEHCLDYLLGDPRRLALGPYSHKHRDSCALIVALYPCLDEAGRGRVDAAILGFQHYKKDRADWDAKTRLDRLRWNRARQLRLLRAVRPELMSEATRRRYEELERALPYIRDKDMEMTGFRAVGSPMSADQMAKAQDEEVLRLFDELTDETTWDHPKSWERGGSIQASRSFEDLAKKHPDRALGLIEKLEPGKHERPVGYAIRGLAEENALRPEELRSLVHSLDERGFASEDFRQDAARCLRAVAFRMKGLPDATCQMLERWLNPWTPPDEPSPENSEKDEERSVLWGMGSAVVSPWGNYPLLDAISTGYLCREPTAANSWLTTLERHLGTSEDPKVWQSLAIELKYLGNAEQARAATFLSTLFERFPNTLQSRQGAILLTFVRWWLPKPIMWDALTQLIEGSWQPGPRAAGELLLLCHALDRDDQDYERLVEDVITGNECDLITTPDQLHDLRLGIAATAANIWKTAELRERASQVLSRLLLVEEDGLPREIMDVFRVTNPLPEDEYTRQLLAHMPHHLACLEHASPFLIDRLKELLSNSAFVEVVCDAAEAVVAVGARKIGDFRTRWAGDGKDLVEIAITLQRFETTRERGLTLFERLMSFERLYIPKLLQEIDRRMED